MRFWICVHLASVYAMSGHSLDTFFPLLLQRYYLLSWFDDSAVSIRSQPVQNDNQSQIKQQREGHHENERESLSSTSITTLLDLSSADKKATTSLFSTSIHSIINDEHCCPLDHSDTIARPLQDSLLMFTHALLSSSRRVTTATSITIVGLDEGCGYDLRTTFWKGCFSVDQFDFKEIVHAELRIWSCFTYP